MKEDHAITKTKKILLEMKAIIKSYLAEYIEFLDRVEQSFKLQRVSFLELTLARLILVYHLLKYMSSLLEKLQG